MSLFNAWRKSLGGASLVSVTLRVRSLTLFPYRGDNMAMRAFIISDDFAETNYLNALFAKLSMQVQSAKNPRAIAETMMTYKPDIVLVSDRSKSFKGIEAAVDLKRKNSKTKIVLIKSNQSSIEGEAKDLDGFLDSPVGIAKLVELVSELLNINLEELSSKLKVNIERAKKAPLDIAGDSQMVSGGNAAQYDKQFVRGGNAKQAKVDVSGNVNVANGKVDVAGDVGSQSNTQSVQGGATPQPGSFNVNASIEKGEKKSRYARLLEDMEPIDTTQTFDREKIREVNNALREADDPESRKDVDEEKRAFVKSLFSK